MNWLILLGCSVLAQPESVEPSGDRTPPPRPIITCQLHDGTQVEGQLVAFSRGLYTLRVAGKTISVPEQDIDWLDARIPLRRLPADRERRLQALWKRFLRSGQPRPFEDLVDESVIPEIAALGPDAVPTILELYEKNSDHYQAVGRVLQSIGPDGIPAMIHIYREKNREVWHPVSYALAYMREDAVPQLEVLLFDKDDNVRSLVADVLYDMSIQGGQAFPTELAGPLLKALDDPAQEVRSKIPSILSRIGRADPRILDKLLRTLSEPKYRPIRTSSVLALGHMAQYLKMDAPELQRIVPALADALEHDSDTSVRMYAAQNLGSLGPRAKMAAVALRKATDDADQNVRDYAEKALSLIGAKLEIALIDAGVTDRLQLEELGALAAKDESQSRIAAAKVSARGPGLLPALAVFVREDLEFRYWPRVAPIIATWGPPVIPDLEKHFVADEHPMLRRTAVLAVARMRKLDLIPDIVPRLMQDPDEFVRRDALQCVSELASRDQSQLIDQAVPLFLRSLEDEHYETRRLALQELERIGIDDDRVLPVLLDRIQDDPDPELRDDLAGVLLSIAQELRSDSEPAGEIISALEQRVRRERNRDARIAAIQALGRLGPAAVDTKPALQQAAKSPYADVSTAAQTALKQLQNSR